MGEVRGDLDQEETGEFKEKYSSSEVLELLREVYPEPMDATGVGDRLDMSRRTAANKLNELVDDDVVATKKIGARARVYWLQPEQAGEEPTH
ncbi:hypothetical protein [Halosolutus halophilus]|uniref:hypothetical protein n=1 Tax=Halosolutus halophilus TaxID=1552990 RepID=UPI002234ECEF|nr:hypothetical protein [Halosolutus halophilus]